MRGLMRGLTMIALLAAVALWTWHGIPATVAVSKVAANGPVIAASDPSLVQDAAADAQKQAEDKCNGPGCNRKMGASAAPLPASVLDFGR